MEFVEGGLDLIWREVECLAMSETVGAFAVFAKVS